MYKLKLATNKKEILEFEKKRSEVFGGQNIEQIEQGAFSSAIEAGDMLAFLCKEEEATIGGMLLELQGKNINVLRLFVEQEKREQGAGSFMLDYVSEHEEFFEDYFGTEIKGIIVEPICSQIDFYYNKGFEGSGARMYKKYCKRKKN